MEWSLSRFDPQAPGALEIAEKISRLRGFSRDGTLTPPPILHARLLGAAPLSPIVVPDSAESSASPSPVPPSPFPRTTRLHLRQSRAGGHPR
ncbi:hypothetical protein NBRC10513v2_007939 [Rhodotorula toruloides]